MSSSNDNSSNVDAEMKKKLELYQKRTEVNQTLSYQKGMERYGIMRKRSIAASSYDPILMVKPEQTFNAGNRRKRSVTWKVDIVEVRLIKTMNYNEKKNEKKRLMKLLCG